ncbi:MAG: DUF5715 family protein [Acidobacteriales bacterium]|nr:DUF5715 family protein [Terriglobales bacterium]
MFAAGLTLLLTMATVNIPSPATQPSAKPQLATKKIKHRKHYRRVAFHSPLKGSRESLMRQNQRVLVEDDLERIQDDAQLEFLTRTSRLVELPTGPTIRVAAHLAPDRRYCRPWTARFLTEFANAHYAKWRGPIQVNSAVRTMEYQQWLRRRNRNAADLEGETASPHLTGATIDVSKRWMSRHQLKWMRNYLLGLQNAGVIDVEEEFRQRVFHITVYKAYEQSRVASESAPTGSAPTTAVTGQQ